VIRCVHTCGATEDRRLERGGALVEFALVSFVLYLLLAGTIEFGRLMFDANALQDVARVAARELAVAPDISAVASFEDALMLDDVKRRVYDPACLVVDLADPAVAPDPDGFFAAMPLVNRALRTLMITEPSRPTLLRYAGALLSEGTGAQCSAVGPNGQAAATGLTVGIPLVDSRIGTGAETITWVPVVQEIRATQDSDCPTRGAFSLVYLAAADGCGPLPPDDPRVTNRGLAAVRINYPYQAATLSGFRSSPPTDTDPLPPNASNPIVADDGVEQTNTAPGAPIDDDPTAVGAYAGPFGLGRQLALAGQTVRPFRKLISAQAIFRREVFQ
jgi:TadE-like protein